MPRDELAVLEKIYLLRTESDCGSETVDKVPMRRTSLSAKRQIERTTHSEQIDRVRLSGSIKDHMPIALEGTTLRLNLDERNGAVIRLLKWLRSISAAQPSPDRFERVNVGRNETRPAAFRKNIQRSFFRFQDHAHRHVNPPAVRKNFNRTAVDQ